MKRYIEEQQVFEISCFKYFLRTSGKVIVPLQTQKQNLEIFARPYLVSRYLGYFLTQRSSGERNSPEI